MPVIQVKTWGEGQGDFVEINDFDFDPGFHVLLGDESSDGKDKLTAAEIKAKLTELNIEFRGNASRDSLQALLDEHEASAALEVIKSALTEKGITFETDADVVTLQALLEAAA
ncbi:hypothetical protein [Pseudomonas gorinensis]